MIEHRWNDGGRAAAGYLGSARDCVVRAIAIAAQLPYDRVYADLGDSVKHYRLTSRSRTAKRIKTNSPKHGLPKEVWHPYILALGWTWHPCMEIGTGCRVHLREGELPPGRLIVRLSGNIAAVIDGVLHDTHDCSRDGTRCVYGFYANEPVEFGEQMGMWGS